MTKEDRTIFLKNEREEEGSKARYSFTIREFISNRLQISTSKYSKIGTNNKGDTVPSYETGKNQWNRTDGRSEKQWGKKNYFK